jgi:hypothetical protein
MFFRSQEILWYIVIKSKNTVVLIFLKINLSINAFLIYFNQRNALNWKNYFYLKKIIMVKAILKNTKIVGSYFMWLKDKIKIINVIKLCYKSI